MLKKIISYLIVILVALMMALNYQLFVFPNSFAPAGLNGVFTMLQHVLGFKLSYSSIILNIPLAILAYFFLGKAKAIRTLTYIIAFSLFLILLDVMDLSAFVYATTVSTLLGPIVAGLITGFGGYIMYKMNACYGGTEFIAGFIHRRYPNFNFFTVIFILNISVAVVSYFVYDYKIEPVLLCIIYSYFSSNVRDNLKRKNQQAVRCEIITENPDELGNQIIEQFHHTATVIQGKGLYSGQDKSVLICVVNPGQITELSKLISKFSGSFMTMSHVDSVTGNFMRLDSHSLPEKVFYDNGEGRSI